MQETCGLNKSYYNWIKGYKGDSYSVTPHVNCCHQQVTIELAPYIAVGICKNCYRLIIGITCKKHVI